ncbi:MAG: type IX secretion system protein PorQ [Bacteroidia bacterium]|nr:type IX secretion system protein PorQ [Bacteroidia bacterium]
MRRYWIFAGLITMVISLQAQVGGKSTYSFLNLNNSARIAALGSNIAFIQDQDLSLAVANPSFLTPEYDGQLSLSFVDYFSDINYGFASYSRDFNQIGTWAATMQFINYGRFSYANVSGDREGEFSGSELAATLGWGRQLTPLFTIGANLKMIYSGLEQYTSYGLAVDVAGTYFQEDKGLTASLIIKNAGLEIAKNYEGDKNSLPFEIQAGVSKALEHLPFRYSIILTHLENWQLRYNDPYDPVLRVDPITGEINERTAAAKAGDELLRHIVIGGELTPAKFLSLRVSYNYQRRQEMKIYDAKGMVGWSWGIGLQVSKFRFSYARSAFHAAGSPNYITISTNLNAW